MQIRPLVCHAEGRTTAAVIGLCAILKRPVHICHVATKEEMAVIIKAKLAGMPVTCEVAPYHLFTFTKVSVARGLQLA
jgi:carbamoyl-phosphate synthase/aspartate carbamoyltransferase/dihydroorotase